MYPAVLKQAEGLREERRRTQDGPWPNPTFPRHDRSLIRVDVLTAAFSDSEAEASSKVGWINFHNAPPLALLFLDGRAQPAF